ncbi:hypothetical protein PC9H_007416 [Pleurotus ostreatus]|uniref:Uncharacterized protein n=1 Tax=Pleurotus ostreatus TaxID=5322 RepID=A0A8H7DSQ6_PLEOS|nr:uncharacterized protein PC9H_007416 [Pleurotus ostreatus]KAF7428195.1 hypothetical protein PC9H_007416 [Pleurotus ostreatus]
MASSSMDSDSKKRKRDYDRPRITYFAPGRTFERLFQEESLEETKSVVRRKLGVPENSDISLAQIRGEQVIDLDDEDDFEAFASLAYRSYSMSVRVRVQKSTAQTPPSMEGMPQVPQVQTPVARPEIPPPIPPAATTNTDPPVTNNAPEISASASISSASTGARKSSVSVASAPNGVDQPAPKRRKRETAKDGPASDHAKKSVSFAEPAAPASDVGSIPPASGADAFNAATNDLVEQTQIEPTPPAPAPKKRGRKKKSDVSALEAAPPPEKSPEAQGISTFVTNENWIPYLPLEPVVKKTRKPRASTTEVSNTTNTTEVPPTSEAAPEAQLEDPSVAPKKRSKRISQKKAKELPAVNEAVIDSGGDQALHDNLVSDVGPTPTTPKPKSSTAAKPVSRAKSKPPAAASAISPAGTKAHHCPICLQSPHHLRFRCPVVKSPSLLEKRVQELKSEPAKAQLLETLEKLLQQAMGTQRSSTANNSPRAAQHATPSTPAITTSAPSQPGAESADTPSAKKVPKKKPTRAPSIDITLTSPPKDLDLANIDPELLLRGPAKRLSITDIPSSDSEEDEDESAQDLEQDDTDAEVRPPRRWKRGGNEPSSSDEDNDGAMDVDSSPDDVSFKTVDRLGQSVEMDMSPDNAMNERASLAPEVRTVSEDVAPAEDDSERRSTEAESSQKPSSAGPTKSSSNSKQDVPLDQPNGTEHVAGTTIFDSTIPKKTTAKPVSKVSQTRPDGTPKAAHAMKDRHGQLPPRTAKDILNAAPPVTASLQPTPPPDLETTARGGKSEGPPKTPAPKAKPTKAKANGKSKMSIDALLSKDSSFTTPQSTQEQDLSLAEWETLPVSPSLATDPGFDELEAGDLSYPMITSTPLPFNTPLFLPSSSQIPPASQTRKISAQESDGEEEEEVENTVKDHSRQSSRQTSVAYRKLTDIARQALFTQELVVQPPRFAKGRIDILKLYGSSQQKEEDSSSGSDSDSDKATPSHIPPSKRAGMAKTPR